MTAPVDGDLALLNREALVAEVRRLRAGIRKHRDSTAQELCWHHPELWGLLPEKVEPAVADSSGALADRDEIARVFERLSVEHRTIVVLHHYLGMTTDEAARTIGVPHGTAKSRLHYATEALRAALEADARGAAQGRALA